jgi:hypothetical protein
MADEFRMNADVFSTASRPQPRKAAEDCPIKLALSGWFGELQPACDKFPQPGNPSKKNSTNDRNIIRGARVVLRISNRGHRVVTVRVYL